MKTPIIEISGGNFVNKGAELMLRTVASRLRRVPSSPLLAAEIKSFDTPEGYCSLGLRPIFPAKGLYPYLISGAMLKSSLVRRTIQWSLEYSLTERMRRSTGLVRTVDCDGLIDISGYAFGDFFPVNKINEFVERGRRYRKRGRPVILLPQMLGPFNNSEHREAFRKLIEVSTRIYARDETSYQAVEKLSAGTDCLRLAPDLTIFSEPNHGTHAKAPTGKYGCIVPNEKVVQKAESEWGDSYIERLVCAGKEMDRHGVKPVVVVHSNEPGDLKLGHHLVNELANQNAFLFYDSSPYELKHFIASSTLLVGSRFHAVVAALSSGVPAITLGWAHKYAAIMKDFNFDKFQHFGSDSIADLCGQVEILCDDDKALSLRRTLDNQKERMSNDHEGMWRDVFDLMEFGSD